MGKQQSKNGFLKNWFEDPTKPNIYNEIRSGDQVRKYLILISDLRQLKNYSLRIKQRNRQVVKVMYYHAIENNYFDIKGTYFNVYCQNIYTVQELLQMRRKQHQHEQQTRNYSHQPQNYSHQIHNTRIQNQYNKTEERIAKFSEIQTVLQIFLVYRQFSEAYGTFRINSSMIGVNVKGQLKVWVNQNFPINYPSSLTANQKIMLDDLINVIKKIDLKRKIIPFLINQSQSQSEWQKLDDVIQFLQARIKNQLRNKTYEVINSYQGSKDRNKIADYHSFGRNFVEIKVASLGKRKQYRPSMPSQQRNIHPSCLAQQIKMRNAVSNDMRHFEMSPKKHISYANLYQPNHPNNNAFSGYLSYQNPRHQQLSNRDGTINYDSINKINIGKTNNYSLEQSGISAIKNNSDFQQQRGKTFNNFQQILSPPKILRTNKQRSPFSHQFLSHNRIATNGTKTLPNSCVITNTHNMHQNIQTQKFYKKLKPQQSQKFCFNHNQNFRGNKSPNQVDKFKSYQKPTEQNEKNKLASSFQYVIPNMVQSKKVNIHGQKYGSEQNSKKSSNIYPKDHDSKFNLSKDVQDSLIFMKQWNSRGKTQNFVAITQKKKPMLEQSKQVPGFISKRKNSSNEIQPKKEDVSEFQVQDRRFTGVQILQKGLMKRPSVQYQSTKRPNEFNRTLGMNENVKKQIVFYEKKPIEQKILNSMKSGGIRDPNCPKYRYPYMKPVHPNINNFNYNISHTNLAADKNQDYFTPIQITAAMQKTQKKKQDAQPNQISKNKSPEKNSQLIKNTNYVNIHQSQQALDDNFAIRSSNQTKGYERSTDVLAQSDPIADKVQDKNKDLQKLSKLRNTQVQTNKPSKFQVENQPQSNPGKPCGQIQKQQIQKEKKRKMKQDMVRMLSMEFGAVIGTVQAPQQLKRQSKHCMDIKSPERFNRAQQVSSAKNSPNKFQKYPNPSQKNYNDQQKNSKTKDQIIRQKVQKKRANFAQLKKQALQILSDDLF